MGEEKKNKEDEYKVEQKKGKIDPVLQIKHDNKKKIKDLDSKISILKLETENLQGKNEQLKKTIEEKDKTIARKDISVKTCQDIINLQDENLKKTRNRFIILFVFNILLLFTMFTMWLICS